MTTRTKMTYISDSQRATAGCAHLWFLQYALRLSEPSKGERMYYGIQWSEVMQRLNDRMDDDSVNEVVEWIDEEEQRHLNERGPNMMADVQDTSRVFDEIRDLLRRYVAHWRLKAPNGVGNVIASEQRLRFPTITPNGNPSTRTGWLGYLDKLVDIDGDLWILDHKTTRVHLDEWREKNENKPQGVTYCWLVQQAFPTRRVRGIIYDGALSKAPKTWDQFSKIATGKRLNKPGKGTLPFTLADQWALAITKNGFSFDDMDTSDDNGNHVDGWYKTVHAGLLKRDKSGFWFDRIVVPVTQQQINRVGRELYQEGTKVRRMADQVGAVRLRVKEAFDSGSVATFARVVSKACRDEGASFPRSPSMCRRYFKLCEFATLCREQSPEAVGRYVYKEWSGDKTTEATEGSSRLHILTVQGTTEDIIKRLENARNRNGDENGQANAGTAATDSAGDSNGKNTQGNLT